jgi:hypothetical protein
MSPSAQPRAATVHNIHEYTRLFLLAEEVRRSGATSLRPGSFLEP